MTDDANDTAKRESFPPRTCASCMCFARNAVGANGECRRGSPARSRIEGQPLSGRWPFVLLTDWCWEHKRKREESPRA